MSGTVHALGVASPAAPIVRKAERLTKDRAKALVAAGIQRASVAGLDKLALAGGCSKRCIEKALSHETLPGVDTLANLLDHDPTILNELLAVKGFQLARLDSSGANDLTVAAGVIGAMGELVRAMDDGIRDHNETLAVASLLRPHMQALQAIIASADVLRGAA